MKRIRKKHPSSLEREINHCLTILNGLDTSNLQKHYALGRLEVLTVIKELADEHREDMRRFWIERACKSDLYYWSKDSYHTLHGLFPEQK